MLPNLQQKIRRCLLRSRQDVSYFTAKEVTWEVDEAHSVAEGPRLIAANEAGLPAAPWDVAAPLPAAYLPADYIRCQ